MAVIRRRRRALGDLLEIWEFIARADAQAADAMVDRFDDAFALLAMNPKSGRARPDIGRGIRSFVVGRYVVFDRPIAGGIHIGRIMHGARNIAPEEIWLGFETGEDR